MSDGTTHALDAIVIKGAREHNLKNIDLTLPRNKLIVVTGLSGSGKSSLAFDTIYAEGQRRYVESLSSYARQFLGQMEKPDVDYIEGLSPAISIDQKSTSRNPRSTVGTVTEIYDYLRLLYARIGVPHCYECGREISSQTAEQIVDQILAFPEGTRIQLLAPVIRGRKGEYTKLFEEIGKEGFARVRIDGEIRELKDKIELDKKRKHTVEVVVDRLVVKPDVRTRLTDSIETTLKLSTGIVTVLYQSAMKANAGTAKPSETVGRGDVQRVVRVRVVRHLVPGARAAAVLVQLAVRRLPGVHRARREDRDRRVEGDPRPHQVDRRRRDRTVVEEHGLRAAIHRPTRTTCSRSSGCCARAAAKPRRPVEELPEDVVDTILYGADKKQKFVYESRSGHQWEYESQFEGVVNNLQRRYSETSSDYVKEEIEKYMSASVCKVCKGARLKPEALGVTIADRNIDADHEDVGRDRRGLLRGVQPERAGSEDLAPDPQGNPRAARVPQERRARLLEPLAQRDDALGRRVAAHPPGDADRLLAGRRPLHPGRTVDRPPPARQRPAAGDARDAARHRQHADRDRARRGHDARGRRGRRHRPGCRRRGRPHSLGRLDRRHGEQSGVADRRVPVGAAVHRDSEAPQEGPQHAERDRREGEQPRAASTSTFRSARSPASPA